MKEDIFSGVRSRRLPGRQSGVERGCREAGSGKRLGGLKRRPGEGGAWGRRGGDAAPRGDGGVQHPGGERPHEEVSEGLRLKRSQDSGTVN